MATSVVKRLQSLKKLAFQLKDACPAEARYLLWTCQVIAGTKVNPEGVCSHCFECLLPGNHRVRLKSKRRITEKIKKLLRREAANWKLNLKQVRQLQKYRNSKSTLLVTCYTCKETSKFYGANRMCLPARPRIPRSLSKTKTDMKTLEAKMPQSVQQETRYSPLTNKSSSKSKCPATTPRTSVSTSSASLKSVKGKKLHCSRLKMLLNCEQKQQNNKGTLRDFLTSV
ncbi:UPF0711 protein C18orf21 homolog [Chiloscyllium plagiosum]|uniref:UPF0711 protein C18orf21 homolog n=1 Tax=Chiloscyllium plagiosum TaxID=36176 RepID=UPI001CB84F86|nr:UPF0711 protein C18orf21 homolog [Chiloscyllium plagiosum]XP_043574991.1 UPF0711 protein C18orf21 homolog [Chiloscyllium plagiosum]XP_043574992.1 UPF0711 protein C18orf21 homolog [Chiloscyllium plagiosum]